MIASSLVILWIGNLGGAQLGWFFCWSYPRSSHQLAMPLQLDGLGWPHLCLMGVGCCLGRLDSPARRLSSWLARAHSHHGLRVLDAAKTRQAPMYLLLFHGPKPAQISEMAKIDCTSGWKELQSHIAKGHSLINEVSCSHLCKQYHRRQ